MPCCQTINDAESMKILLVLIFFIVIVIASYAYVFGCPNVVTFAKCSPEGGESLFALLVCAALLMGIGQLK